MTIPTTPEEIATKLETIHSYLDSNWIQKAAHLIREGEKHRAALTEIRDYEGRYEDYFDMCSSLKHIARHALREDQ